MDIRISLKSHQNVTYLIVVLIFALVSAVAVVLRFVATRRAGRKPHVEDWLALASLLLQLASGAINLSGILIVTSAAYEVELGVAAYDMVVVGAKLLWAAAFPYYYQQLLAKLSILALYYRLFKVNPMFKRCFDALVIYHAIWITLVSFIAGFACWPLATLWDPRVHGHCLPVDRVIATTETINSFGDFLLVGTAIAIVRKVQISKTSKTKLSICFGLGAIAGIIGFVKIGLCVNKDPVAIGILVSLWSNIQSGVVVLCCCVPVYQPLLPSAGSWARLRSKFSFPQIRLSESRSTASQFSDLEFQAGCPGGHSSWMQRGDGCVWSNVSTGEGRWVHEDGNELRAIQVRKEIEIS